MEVKPETLIAWTFSFLFLFGVFCFIVIRAVPQGGGSVNSNGLTQSEQEYWDSRSQEEKIQILSDYYEDTNPNW